MKVKFWGVRGSIAAPGPNTVRYGGNTSCYEIVTKAGTRLLLDAGTGIREAGLSLLPLMPTTTHILISHTHWDHIQGFPFFTPAFVPGNVVNMYGPIQYSKDLATVIRMQMDYEVFPVREAELKSRLYYHNLGEGVTEINDVRLYTKYTNHPVMTLSYRIEADGQSIVYTGDTEPYFNVLLTGGRTPDQIDPQDLQEIEDEVRIQNQRHIDFCREADLLIHDAQYTESEYLLNRRGWGHTPIEHAIFVGRRAGVKRLALSHHDPTRPDAALTDFQEKYGALNREICPEMELFFAAEKTEIEL